jgi:hypothetical protein
MDRVKVVGLFTDKSRKTEFFILKHNGRHIAALPEMYVSFYVGDGREAALKVLTGLLPAGDAEKLYNTIFEYVHPHGDEEMGFISWFEEKYGLSWNTFNEGMQKSGAKLLERDEAFNHAVSRYYKEKELAGKRQRGLSK